MESISQPSPLSIDVRRGSVPDVVVPSPKAPLTIRQRVIELQKKSLDLLHRCQELDNLERETHSLKKSIKKVKNQTDIDSTKSEISKRNILIQKQMNSLSMLKENLDAETELLKSLDLFSANDLAQIFDMENSFRDRFERQSDPIKRASLEYINIDVLSPLVKNAKKFIKGNKDRHSVAKSAAMKGAAARAGFDAIQARSLTKPVVRKNVQSAQTVVLLPKEGAVLKKLTSKAKKEESTAIHLFDMMNPRAALGTFNFKDTSTARLGMQKSSQLPPGIYPLSHLSSGSIEFVKGRVSEEDKAILNNPLVESYREAKKKNWQVKTGDTEEWETISFNELEKRYTSGALSTSSFIQSVGDQEGEALTLQAHTDGNSPLFRALSFTPSSKTSDSYVTPDLSGPKNLALFQLCENYIWQYTDTQGVERETDFETLYGLFLIGNFDRVTGIKELSSGLVPPETHMEELMQAAIDILTGPLKILTPQLYYGSESTVDPLLDVQAKPFIDMNRFEETDSTLLENLMTKLTPDSEYNAVLTGVIQLLDFHGKNVGIKVVPTENMKKFQNTVFTLNNGKKISFSDLLSISLKEGLDPNLQLTYTQKGVTITDRLKHLKDLNGALHPSTELVIFDTDRSISESNRLQFQLVNGRQTHLIPVRSVLLELAWKDKQLNQETIARLTDTSGRATLVAWMKKADAPIYKRVSEEARQSVQKKVAPILERYNLSDFSMNEYSIETLQKLFSEEICDITKPTHVEIWTILERDLSSVTVRPGDTLEKIAKRHHVTVDQIQSANEEIDLTEGSKIKIPYDLTSNSEATQKRRARIAPQLFPRMTLDQQSSLLERQDNIKKYLENYKALMTSTKTGEELIEQTATFIMAKETPLNSLQRRSFAEHFKRHLSDTDHGWINIVRQDLKGICQPSYFNVMKSMYPLLGDAFQLEIEMGSSSKKAGNKIGHYVSPLETSISTAEQTGNTKAKWFAASLTKEIQAATKPAFFRIG